MLNEYKQEPKNLFKASEIRFYDLCFKRFVMTVRTRPFKVCMLLHIWNMSFLVGQLCIHWIYQESFWVLAFFYFSGQTKSDHWFDANNFSFA